MQNNTQKLPVLLMVLGGLAFGTVAVPAYAENIIPTVDVSYALGQTDATLKYIPDEKVERFSLDFANKSKPPYQIRTSKDGTTITFYKIFKLNTINLQNYKYADKITQKKLSNKSFEITFPQPLANSFEHMNAVVLDFYPDGSKTEIKAATEIKPLKISSLSFSWNAPVGLSVFKRGKYLWIVFNHFQQLNTEELIRNAQPLVKDIIQLPHSSATILRVEPKDEVFSEVRKEGLLWIVDLYNRKTERKVHNVAISANFSLPDRPYLQVDLPHTEEAFSYLDPEIGDMIMAITSSEEGYAFLEGYTYPDMRFLPSSQGIALNSDAFDIALTRNNTGFILQTTQHPLNITPDGDYLKQQAESLQDIGDISISNILKMPVIRKNFADSEKFLKTQVNIAPQADKARFQMDLARYYLTNSLATNALGILEKLEQEQQPTQKLNLMLGIGNMLASRNDRAVDYFMKPEFAADNEVKLWRLLALGERKANAEYKMDIVANTHFLHTYPARIKKRMALAGIQYALQLKDDALAQLFIDILKELPRTAETDTLINYYDAEKIRLQGYIRSALPFYKIVANSEFEKYAALGRFRLAEFSSDLTNTSLKSVIREFERLKFAWGEYKFKINVLNRLIELYLKTENYYMALKSMRDLSILTSDQKSVIERRMIEIMEEIYYYNNDNDFSPIKSLALFDDFGYLISRSEHQTAIMLKLADRLVAVDLLDRAYKILHGYMIEKASELTDTERSAMGSRLALLHLFKNEPDRAVENLDETESPNIPETLMLQRKIIRAKALSQLNHIDEALALIDNDYSKNAILLKTEIFWNNQRWSEAADSIRMLIEKPVEGKPLSDEQIRYILDWTTALKKAGKETVIVRVRNTFGPYFEKTPYSSIFRLLTDTLEKNKISIKNINQAVQDAATFSDFAKLYTKSLLNDSVTNDNGNQ